MKQAKCAGYWDLSDFLPFDAAIQYWCDGSPGCEVAKRYALISALENDKVEYRRSDRKTYDDSVHELCKRGLLLVDRKSFLAWAKSVSDEVEKQNLQKNMAVNPRAETTYVNMIGGFISLLLGTTPGGIPISVYKNQAAIIDALLAFFPNTPGITKRTLETKFAQALRELKATS